MRLPSTLPSSHEVAPRTADFVHMVERFRDRIAVRNQQGTATYAEIGAHAAALASLLRGRGIGPGDCVAVFLHNQIAAVWAGSAAGPTAPARCS
jgi:malonyl-CoA/methylmalonyl-CoA synthetase